ncbi:MAG: DUF512 domain-containing protein [Vampirovibrionales bacterium]|nr:DUF512 domain-containing protein [Vampirovibrionales bacterium]
MISKSNVTEEARATRPMRAVVHAVVPGSIAEALGLEPGDLVVAVNGRSDLEDMLDFQFELADSVYLELTVVHKGSSAKIEETTEIGEIYEIEKEPDEDLGLVFESPIFMPIKTCNNACPFCFIDQQPEGLRPSLYIKDDDYRLSYFHNTYITLTNLTPHDKERMARLRPGPLYVSVHATTPEVRQRLLLNPKAGDILEKLNWLKSLEIPFHAQIVLCPGINDGPVLAQTLKDLSTLSPELLSIAVVPVGLTQYRGDLPDLLPVDAECAQSVIELVERFNGNRAQIGQEPLAHLSDEFYLKAGLPFPAYETYQDFPQLDDGVGTARLLLSEFFGLEKQLPEKLVTPQKLLLLTGKLGMMVLQPIINRLNTVENLFIDMVAVENYFWGKAVDVAGLITGQDIIKTLEKYDIRQYQAVVMPAIMLRHGTQDFLDGMTVSQVAKAAALPIRVVQDPYSAQELMDTVLRGAESSSESLSKRWER